MSADDILEDLGTESKKPIKGLPETPDEVMIFGVLVTEPKHIDEITLESIRKS